IADSVHRAKKNVNHLQSLIDDKIEIYSKDYSEAEINQMFKKYQPMAEYVWLKGEKEKINYEFNEFFLTLQKQREKLDES
ncbi:hypothetical protein V7111_19850, partial [Neobacillus niacini]|uniref:hypothetical protein n=1 Tax=Neobacillus niacini TaxID=86668 RepID=UPI0030030812